MSELLYKELCYKIIGAAFEVHNSLGSGLKEKVYGDALEVILKEEKIPFIREHYYSVKFRDKVIAKRYFDFFIDDKIVVEVKIGYDNYREACNQIFEYLKSSGIRLGLIIRFTKDGVKTKRIPNIY